MSSHDNREEALFERCLGLPPGEREAYLREQCPDEPELVESVLALLSSHDVAGEFLEELPTQDSFEVASRLGRMAPTEERPGDQIGRYRLLELIGEGAWGTVWIARQTEDIDRQVAIKILKVGMDTGDFLARFEAERQTLAMMDHPNIAKVLDAGATERGRPYLVMELVKGVQILEFADKNRLNVRERVKLFTKVCRALHHAHRKGVVHRDLKPSNILVSAQYDEALPKVIDFGVAKSNQFRGSGGELYTSMHAFIGTPVYSSPEQLEFTGRDVDARSDIYSLGALLYELVCGATPFDGGDGSREAMSAFVRQVREEDPPRPSQRFAGLTEEEKGRIATKRKVSVGKLESALKGELDWIALKCLEKDPSRRYDGAKDLADDLQAFLDNQAVAASAPSPLYRLRKSILRNRPTYAIWVEMGAVLAACFAVVFYYAIKQPRYDSSTPFDISPDSSIQLTDKSIAVLPLENLSPDVENAYFTGAIHAEFIDQLDKIGDLRVIDRTSVKRYQDTLKPSMSIGEELGVRYIIEGSVYRERDRVAISLSLIDLKTQQRMWSRTYERSTEDLFSLRSEVALDVAGELQAFLSSDEIELVEEFPTRSREAYDAYLKSREYWGSGEEIPYLKRAVEIDPDFYEAWAALAWRGLFRFSGASRGDPELLVMAKEAIDNLVRLKPNYFLTYNLQSGYEIHANHDLEAALAYRLKSKASGGDGREVGWSYLQLGRLDLARQLIEKALIDDPLDPASNSRLYAVYTCLGLWDEAEAHLKDQLRRLASLPNGVGGEVNPTKRYERYLAQLDFLSHGDLEELVEGFKALPGTLETPMGRLWSDLVSRDFAGVLKHLEEIRFEPDNPFPVFNAGHGAPGIELIVSTQLNNSLDLEPFSLISALVHHVTGARETSLIKADEAKSYWEDAIVGYHKVDPNHLAFLTICHALEGDRAKMEATIPKIRELTETVNWQFRAQAKCEMKLAIAYLVLGDEEKALDLLEYANEIHSPMFISRELELWFIFDRLKGNPRFEALLGKDEGRVRSDESRITQRDDSTDQPSDLIIPDSKSIAILPFENISGREEHEPYSKGLHRILLTRISQLKDLRSISPTSVDAYRGTSKRLNQVARELGVAHLLTGDVQIRGEKIRVNVQLIKAATEYQLWGKTYTRDLTAENFFDIESDIAESIADILMAVLTPQERDQLAKFPTRNTEALEIFIEGTVIMESAIQTRREESIDFLRKAIDLDPGFVLAYVNLGRAYLSETSVSVRDKDWWEEAFSNAEVAAAMALQLDSDSAEAHTLLGQIQLEKTNRFGFEGDLDLAKRSIEKALELNPNYAEAYVQRGELLLKELDGEVVRGEGAKRLALSWFRKAIDLDPQNHLYRNRLGFLLNELSAFDESREHFEAAIRINPEFAAGIRHLAIQMFSVFGQYDKALSLFRQAVVIDRTRFEPHELLFHCYWTLGDEREAYRWHKAGMGSGIGWNAGGPADQAMYLVAHYQMRGDHNRYLEQLRIAVERSSNWSNYRRLLLNEDMRDGRLRIALRRYQKLFPYLFEEVVIMEQQRLTADGAGTMEPRNQALAAMELAEILVRLGEKKRARYLLDQAWRFFQRYPKRTNWHWFYLYGYGIRDAVRFALIGEKEEALKAIDEAVNEGFRDRLELESSALDDLREEPAFKALMEIVEVDWARQWTNVRHMEANGELAPIPKEPRYDLETPAKILVEN